MFSNHNTAIETITIQPRHELQVLEAKAVWKNTFWYG
jgi:hypothetical protein